MEAPRLKEWRARRALSQRALAAAAGVTQTTLVRMEAGKPAHPSTVGKLARALNVDPAELLGLTPAERPAAQA